MTSEYRKAFIDRLIEQDKKFWDSVKKDFTTKKEKEMDYRVEYQVDPEHQNNINYYHVEVTDTEGERLLWIGKDFVKRTYPIAMFSVWATCSATAMNLALDDIGKKIKNLPKPKMCKWAIKCTHQFPADNRTKPYFCEYPLPWAISKGYCQTEYFDTCKCFEEAK
jgi:hypothetical protein